MSSRIFLSTSVLVRWLVGLSVTAQNYNPPNGPIYQIWAQKQAYFDSIRPLMPDSVFFHEGGEYAEFQKWFRYWEPRLAPHGDPEIHDQLMQNYDALQAHGVGGSSFRSGNADPWHEIGPKRRTNGMIGIGPIRSITIDPLDANNMLCTSSSGGLFYTMDAGDSWNNAGTDVGWAHSGCQSAMYYPGSSASWYAISAYALYQGANAMSYIGGIFRTTDFGGEWDRIGDHADFTGSSTETQKLLFDAKSNGQGDHRLFLAATKGLYVCDNPAATDPASVDWDLVNITPLPSFAPWTNVTVDPVVRCYDIEYLPSANTSTLCAAMRFKVTHQVGADIVTAQVWRFMLSTDNGDTWGEVPDQPAVDVTIGWAAVETSAAAPNSFYCHASKSSSWVKVYDVFTGWSPTDMASGFSPGYGAANGFGVDQVNPNSVFVSTGTSMYWYLNGLVQGIVNSGHPDVEDIVGHPSQENAIWVANHGGVYLCDPTDGQQWADRSKDLGVAEVDALSTSETNPGFMVTGLNHDNATMTRTPYTEDWEPDWDRFTGNIGDGTRCWVSRQDPNTVYTSWQSGHWLRSDNAMTSNTDISIELPSQWWSEGAIHRLNADHIYRATKKNLGNYSLTTTDANGDPVIHSGSNVRIEIVRSEDAGVTNQYISDFANVPEVARPAEVIGNNFESFDNGQFWWIRNTPANTDHLYACLDNWNWQQRLFRNTDITAADPEVVIASWEEVPHPRRAPLDSGDDDREPIISSIAFDPEEENIIYIAYGSSQFGPGWALLGDLAEKMVFRLDLSNISEDYPTSGKFGCGGAHPCSDITMNLPNTSTELDGLVYEQGSDGGLYISTEAGVYFTDNKRISAYDPGAPEDADDMSNTAGWVRLGDALPHVATRGLEINYVVNRIRAGTLGRGVWEHHLHCPDEWDFSETGLYTAGKFLEARNDISSSAVLPAGMQVSYRAGNQVHLGPDFHATTGVQFHAFVHPCDVPGNSLHPKSLFLDQGASDATPSIRASACLSVFPNPTSGSFTVQADFVTDQGYATVRFYGPMGDLVMSTTMKGAERRFTDCGLRGLYMVMVECNGVRRTQKLVLQ